MNPITLPSEIECNLKIQQKVAQVIDCLSRMQDVLPPAAFKCTNLSYADVQSRRAIDALVEIRNLLAWMQTTHDAR